MTKNKTLTSANMDGIKATCCFLLALFCLVLVSWDGLVHVPAYWQKEEYSHGYLIPIIAALIGWHRLTKTQPSPQASWHGLWLLCVSFLLSLLSEFVAFEALSNYSFLIGLVAITVAFWGTRVVPALIPAFAFLFFAVPLPHNVYGFISVQMQLISSTLGVWILQFLNVSVFQEGNIIDLGGVKLQVAEACNGLRYLFPLMGIGFLVALLMETRMWKRIFVFLSTIPLTIVINSLRIALIGISVNVWGRGMAEGFVHVFEGYVVFFVCLSLLLAEVSLLSFFGTKGVLHLEYFGLARGPILKGRPVLTAASVTCVLFCLSFVPITYSSLVKNRVEKPPQTPDFISFPRSIGAWKGQKANLSEQELHILDLTDYWLADYSHEDGGPSLINLYIAYYDNQRMRANIHIPLNCIIGGGWQVSEQKKIEISVDDVKLPVVRMVVHKGDDTNIVYYWFDQRGRMMNSQIEMKWYLLLDSIFMGRTDGALIRVTTGIYANEAEGDGDKRLRDFLRQGYPSIRHFIPEGAV